MRIRHGHTRRTPNGRISSPEYRAFAAMKNRCLNPRQARFKDYGGRGITVCDRWLRGDGSRTGFECFLMDIGPKPGPAFTLDRIDNDRGYEPSNVRWATRLEQGRNTRATRLVRVADMELSLAEAVARWGACRYPTALRRLRLAWSHEDAIMTPTGSAPFRVEVPF